MSRVALIIGGASGIGLATSVALARDHTVAVADISGSEIAISHLAGAGHASFAVDVLDESAITRLFDVVEKDLGPIAVLVYCAGVTGYVEGKRPSLQETTLQNWNAVFAVNSVGAFLCVRELFRRRAKQAVPNARVVLIGSMAAQDGGKNSPAAYVSSKGAVHALVKAAMNEGVALGITVNCVAPGVVDTPLFRSAVPVERRATAVAHLPLARAGMPGEVAAAVEFLASSNSSFICGACIDVNGGARLS